MKMRKRIVSFAVALIMICTQVVVPFAFAEGGDDGGLDASAFERIIIRSGTAEGPVVRNLLDPSDNTPIDPGKDYYLEVQFKNPAKTNETAFVALDYGTEDGKANGLYYFNPPGGTDNKNITARDIQHDFLKSVYSYTNYPNPTYGNSNQNALSLLDGKIVYLVKNENAENASIKLSCSLNVSPEFCNDVLNDALRISCGIIENDALKETSEYKLDKLILNYNPVFPTYFTNTLNGTIDGKGILGMRVWSSTENIPIVYDEISYNLIAPKFAKFDTISFGYNSVSAGPTSATTGVVTISEPTPYDDDYVRYNIKITNGYKTPAGTVDVSVRFAFDRDAMPEKLTNWKVWTEAGTIKPAAGGTPINIAAIGKKDITIIDPLDDVTVVNVNPNTHTVYNNTIQTGDAYGYMTLMGMANITNNSEKATPYEKIYEADYNVTKTAAAITAITVPKGTNTNPVIKFEGIDETGAVVKDTIDVAAKNKVDSDYYLFFAKDLGIKSFNKVTADIGSIRGGYLANSWGANWSFGSSKAAAYGYFTTPEVGIQVKNEYHLYNKNPEDRDKKNGDLLMTSIVTSTDVAADAFQISFSESNIQNTSNKVTNSFEAGSDIKLVTGQIHPYSVPGSNKTTVNGANFTAGSTMLLNDPVIYLTLPNGITYSSLKFEDMSYNPKGSNISNTVADYEIENVSYLNTTDDGVSIYKISFKNVPCLGYYDGDGNSHRLRYNITLSTAKTLSTRRYAINDLIHITSNTTPFIGMKYSSSTNGVSDYTADIYGINGGMPLSAPAPNKDPDPPIGFGIQGLSEIMVSSAITVSKVNDEPVQDPTWYTYDSSDPNSIALLGIKSEGTYKVTLRNPGTTLTEVDMKMFIPIPKKDSNLGVAFMPNANSFDMNFTWDESDIEAMGLVATYVKIDGNYSTISSADTINTNISYTLCDKSEANAILLTLVGEFGENTSKVVEFKFTTNASADELGKVNIWRDAYYYKSKMDPSGRSLYGDYVASETAGGTLSGEVFLDLNRNGIKDGSESPVEGVTVTLKDSKKKIYSTTTDAEGKYEFKAVREDTVAVTMSADTTMGQRFNINPVSPVENKICSSVTPDADGLSATKTIQVNTGVNIINAAMGQYYTVTYNGNGSTAGIVPKTQEYAADEDANVSVKPDSLGKKGQTFVSWNTKADGTGTSYAPGATFKVESNVILYAQWTPATYTITFNYTGATGNNSIQTKDVVYNTLVGESGWPGAPNANPTKLGYTFKDWATGNPNNTTAIGSTYKYNTKVTFTDNTTLYAWWNEKTGFVVEYDSAGGTDVANKTVKWTDTVISETVPTKTGYTFDGWVLGTTKITDTTKFSNLATTDADGTTITLTATWKEKNNYKVVYDTNGGTAVADKTGVSWSDKNLLPTTNPTKADSGSMKYSIVGWRLGTFEGPEVTNDLVYNNLVGGDDTIESITLVAVWQERLNCTVHYDTDGGTSVNDKLNVAKPDANLLPTTNPTKAGYTFTGWYYGDAEVTNATVYGDLTEEDELTLIAHWTPKTYTINYITNNNTTIEPKTGVNWEGTSLIPTDDPVKTGYTFTGWYLQDSTAVVNNTSKYSELVANDAVSSITLEARWEMKSGYVVTYNTAGGSAAPVKSGLRWNAANLNDATSSRLGYTLAGWTYNNSDVLATTTYASLAVDDTKTSIELTAKWTPKTGYTVKYNTDGGTLIADKTGVSWTTTGLIPDAIPEKTGVVFHHWSCERAETVAGTHAFSDLSSSDAAGTTITLVAKYVENTSYTVHYDTNGGNPAAIADKLNVSWSGKNLTPIDNPTKTGYTFDGWYNGNIKVTDTTSYNVATGGVDTPSITLTAKWVENAYTIEYNANTGTGSMEATVTKYGDTVALSENTFIKDGYSFSKWNTIADGSGTDYTDKQEVTNLTTTKDGVVTLYAQWGPKSYTIAFDKNATNAIGTMNSQSAIYDEEVTLSANAFARAGYLFDGWNTASDGSGTAYTDGQKTNNIAAEGTVTLYAQWKPIEYTIKLDGNGSSDAAMADIPATYDAPVALTDNTYTYAGYTFEGWNTAANGSGENYEDKASVSNLASTSGAEVTLYAQWSPVTYSITYDLAEGQIDTINPETYTVESDNFTLNNPTRENYTFAGWVGTDIVDPTLSVTIAKGSVGNRTYTATWTLNKYDVTYDGNGATGNVPEDTDEHDAGSTVTVVDGTPTRPDHDFLGWELDENTVLSEGDTFTMPDAPVVLKAKWVKRPTIEFDTEGGTEVSAQIVDADYKLVKPEDPIRRGYEFVGWVIDTETMAAFDFDAPIPTGLVKLYAAWKPIVYTITYDLGGGTLAGVNPGTYTIETPDFTLIKPVKEGYVFVGWLLSSDEMPMGRAAVPNPNIVVEKGSVGNLTLTAIWMEEEPEPSPTPSPSPDAGVPTPTPGGEASPSPTPTPELDKTPNTADSFDMVLVLTLLIASGSIFASAVVSKRRND